MARILIPDPLDLPQLAALRGLGKRGHVCDVAWSFSSRQDRYLGKHCLGRYCHQVHEIPDPSKSVEGYAESVIDLCRSGIYDVVLPTRGLSLETLLPHRAVINNNCATLMPTPAQFSLGIDKFTTFDLCRKLGVIYPETVFLSDELDIEATAKRLGYPVVVKHRRNFGGSRGVMMVSDPAGLSAAVDDLAGLTDSRQDLMLQKFLPGTIVDACLVAKNGKIGGMVTQERRLMYPISGGVACIVATVDLPELEKLVASIVETLDWTGPAQIEFKWDPLLRRFSLIEINPRFWATTGAWLKAGANFPALAVDLALNREPPEFPRLPANLRFKYLIGRTPASLVQLWRSRGRGALKDPRSYSRTWYDFDLGDPLPDLFRCFTELRRAFSGGYKLIDRTLPQEFDPSFSSDDWASREPECAPDQQENAAVAR